MRPRLTLASGVGSQFLLHPQGHCNIDGLTSQVWYATYTVLPEPAIPIAHTQCILQSGFSVCVQSGQQAVDSRQMTGQPTYKYEDALGQAGLPLYSPYSEASGHAHSLVASTKQLRHFSSLPSSRQSSSSPNTSKAAGLTRSQLAEEKHIKRQNSVSEARGGAQPRPMSAERSRPRSASSQRPARDSQTWESASRATRRQSTGRSDSRAEAHSTYDGNGYPQSLSKAASRPASPDPGSPTIPAYKHLPSTFASRTQLPSRHSFGATGSPATDPAHLSPSIPSAPLLQHYSTGASMGGHPYAAQASDCWGQEHQLKKRTTPAEKNAGAQDFLSLLEARDAKVANASYSVPRRSSSNARELFGRPGQFVSSLGDKIRR